MLKELCDFFNFEQRYSRIENLKKIRSEDKQKLLRFINAKCNGICEFQIRALNRFLEQVYRGELRGPLLGANPTICTLCYVALKWRRPDLKLVTQVSHNVYHAESFYAEDFNETFIVPLIVSDKKTTLIPKIFQHSCWYLYINSIDNESLVRKTGRRILKLSKNHESIRADYYSSDPLKPSWTGVAKFDSISGHLIISLKSSANPLRCMTMDFNTKYNYDIDNFEGEITFTTIKDLDKHMQTKIFIVKVPCEANLSIKDLSEGEDKSIGKIEAKLKLVKAKIISDLSSHPCHDKE